MTVYRLTGAVVYRKIGDETFLVPISKGVGDLNKLYVFDGVGDFAWSLLDGKRNLDEIVIEVLNRYDIDAGTAKQDLIEFFEKLRQIGAVELA